MKDQAGLYRVVLSYAVYGVEVDAHGVIRNTAPISQWVKGKPIWYLKNWVRSKGGTVEKIAG